MARSIWKGSIGFGLVSINVEMYTAVKERRIRFHLVSADGRCRLRQKLYCPETGKEYEYSQTAKGYEVDNDEIIVINPEELEALKPKSGHLIEIQEFVEIAEIDPLYYDRSYILLPAERAERAYGLLRESIERSRKVGLGSVVMRERQYFGVLRTYDHMLIFSTMHYADELQRAKDFDLPQIPPAHREELALAQQLISSMERPFRPEQFKDSYRLEVEKYLRKRAAGQTVQLKRSGEQRAPRSKVVSLVDRLKTSLKAPKQSSANNNGAGKQGGHHTTDPHHTGPSSRRKKAAHS